METVKVLFLVAIFFGSLIGFSAAHNWWALGAFFMGICFAIGAQAMSDDK